MSPLAQAVMRGEWAWAGIPGMRFEMQGGNAVLVTPWGHGTWGVVPSRTDVLVAEFAQQVPYPNPNPNPNPSPNPSPSSNPNQELGNPASSIKLLHAAYPRYARWAVRGIA